MVAISKQPYNMHKCLYVELPIGTLGDLKVPLSDYQPCSAGDYSGRLSQWFLRVLGSYPAVRGGPDCAKDQI